MQQFIEQQTKFKGFLSILNLSNNIFHSLPLPQLKMQEQNFKPQLKVVESYAEAPLITCKSISVGMNLFAKELVKLRLWHFSILRKEKR